MNGLMTEREWRRAQRQRRPCPDWWGAQCVMNAPRKQSLKQDRAFHAFLLLLSLTASLCMPVFTPSVQRSEYPQAQAVFAADKPAVRSVKAITYAMPEDVVYRSHTYTRDQLLRGKLLLIDEAHPLPGDVYAPNTRSIASYGKGMVPVNDLSVKCGEETITALAELFSLLRAQGVSGLCVWRGTQSAAEQQAERIARLRALAAKMTLEEATRRLMVEYDTPEASQRQQQYAVEIRMSVGGSAEPDAQPLESTETGRALLRTAWRSGFVRCGTSGASAYTFRYVGQAHATAMTYLDLNLPAYLEWLHEKGVVAVAQEGRLKYLILCKPASGARVAFSLPEGARFEASLDNMGYAVVACTFE